MELKTTIKSTKDYDIFVSPETNRKISGTHAERLAMSISKRNLMQDNPILVTPKSNGKHLVIDGQHRLQACKELKIEVWYREAFHADSDDIKTLNVINRNWNSKDHLRYHVKKNNINYIKFQSFMNEHDISSVEFTLKLFDKAGLQFKQHGHQLNHISGKIKDNFREGGFAYPENDSEARLHIRNIKEIAKCLFMERWDNASLTCAYFNSICGTEKYRQDRMIHKLELFPEDKYSKGFMSGRRCVEYLQEIYNKKERNANQIVFNTSKMS